MADELKTEERQNVSAPWEYSRHKLARELHLSPDTIDAMPADLAMQSNIVTNIEALTTLWIQKLGSLTKDQYELLTGFLFDEED